MTTDSANQSKGPTKGSLLVLFLTVFVDLLGFGMVMPLLAIYADTFAMDAGGWTIGLLMASFSFMQFIFAPLWGMLSDRIGRRPVLIVGLAGSVIFYGIFAYASAINSLFWLFASRIGAGIAGATIPTTQAYIADTTTPEKRSHGMALIGMAMGFGFTFGPLLGFLALPAGEGNPGPWPGIVASGLSAVALLMAIFLLPESKPPGIQHTARKWLDIAGLRHALARPSILILLAGYFLCVFAFVQFETTLSLLLWRSDHGNAHTPFDFSWRKLMLTFAFVGFVLAIVQGAIIRPLTKRLSDFTLLQIGIALEIVGFGVLIYSIQQASEAWMFAGLAVISSGFAFIQPSLHALVSNWTPADKQGAVLGFAQSLNAMGRILGSAIGIPLLKQGINLPYLSAAGLMAVTAVAIGMASRLHARES
ncbi:MAG: MFS transporter [Pirellulaceae bacterium]